MHHRPVIADAEARRDGEDETGHLHDEGPGTEEVANHKAAQDRLHLGYSAA